MDWFRSSWVLLVGWLGCAACPGPAGDGAARFPDGFLWGAAMAGFQVDMGCPTLPESVCTDPNSDWYAWVTNPELIADESLHIDGDPLGGSPGHWELYEQDFDLARDEVGLNAIRTSVEWSRLFPTSTVGIEDHQGLLEVADQAALAHYRAYFAALRARGLTPLVTLHHYTIPAWLHDAVGCHRDLAGCTRRGWLDRQTMVHEIAKYAGFVAAELGDQVDLWATLNEPMAVVLAGYVMPTAERSNPPGAVFAFDQAKAAEAAMIEAHARMVDAVRANDAVDADGDGAAARVGLVFAFSPAHPVDARSELDLRAVDDLMYLYDFAFLDGVALGRLDEDLDGAAEERPDLQGRLDFLGINYYATLRVRGSPGPVFPAFSPLSRFDPLTLEVDKLYPQGIHEALTTLAARYPGLPIVITENNVPFDGVTDTRPEYLVYTLRWLWRAIQDGVPVEGYFYWSLMDNYEWNIGTGYYTGLYGVEPSDPSKARVARQGLIDTFGRIARDDALPADLLASHPLPGDDGNR